MKAKSSTMPNYQKPSIITEEQRKIFSQVLMLLQPYSKRLDNRKNTPEQYELWTRHNFRSQSMNPRNKRGILFAGVLILKDGIGFYFYPLYLEPSFDAKIDEHIRKLYKGGSAFRFDELLSDASIEKLNLLLLEGWQYYQQHSWVTE